MMVCQRERRAPWAEFVKSESVTISARRRQLRDAAAERKFGQRGARALENFP
jgi:hypothetical protein